MQARSAYLDTLRSLALLRVVLFHASGWWVLEGIPAMPIMFFVAGALFASSLERKELRPLLFDRYRRILLPYWAYIVPVVAIWVALGVVSEVPLLAWPGFVLPVVSVNGMAGPPGTPVAFTWMALWYLQMHMLLSLLGPAMRSIQRRWPRAYWMGMVVLAVLLAPIGVGAVFAWGLFWSLGYLFHDGTLTPLVMRHRRWVLAATGPLGAGLFLVFGADAEPLAGLGLLLLVVFAMVAVVGLQPVAERHLRGRRVAAVLHWSSRRSVTIYLWHMVIIFSVAHFALPGSDEAVLRVAWTLGLLPLVCAVLGWAEDLGARQRPSLWPRPGRSGAWSRGAQSVPKMRSPASPRPGTM